MLKNVWLVGQKGEENFKKDVNERNFACYHRNPYNVNLFMVFDFGRIEHGYLNINQLGLPVCYLTFIPFPFLCFFTVFLFLLPELSWIILDGFLRLIVSVSLTILMHPYLLFPVCYFLQFKITF